MIRSDRGFDFVAPNGGVIFIHIQAAGFQPRTLLLTDALDPQNCTTSRVSRCVVRVRIELQPIRSEGESGPVGRAFSIDSSRGISFDTQLITSLPLPLFRNPDVLLGLAPGFAQPPQTFATVGPSFAPESVLRVRSPLMAFAPETMTLLLTGHMQTTKSLESADRVLSHPSPNQSIVLITIRRSQRTVMQKMVARWAGYKCTLESWRSRRTSSAYALGRSAALDAKDYFQTNIRDYPAKYQQLIPVTTDGSLAGQPVQLGLSRRTRGSLQFVIT